MAKPVKDAKLLHQLLGYTEIVERGKGHIRTQKPGTQERRLQVTVGGRGWHFGDGPFTEANEVDTAWVDADPILDEPWQKKMVLADYNAYAFREATLGFDQGQLIKYVHPASGESVAFQPQQLQWTNDLDQISPIADPQAVAAAIDDDRLAWADAYGSGIDFRWHTHTTKMAKYVDIASLDQLGSPPQFVIDGGNPVHRIGLIFQKSSGVEIWVDGILWDEKANNPRTTLSHVEFRLASTGETLWRFLAPVGWDSGRYPNDPTEGTVHPTMRLRKSAQNLFVEILTPWSWLETANYPVTLDATIDDGVDTGTDDGHARDGAYDNGGSNTYVGRGPGITNARSWFLFGTISGLSGQSITTSYISVRFQNFGTACKTNIFAEYAAGPSYPTSEDDYDSRTETSAFVPWDDASNSDTVQDSDSLNSVIQELADNFDSSTILILWKNDGSGNNNYYTVRTHESTLDPADIHIEYEAGGGVEVTVPAAALALTGYAPTVEVTANVNIEIPVAALSLTGYVPTVETPVDIEIPVAALTLTGYVPTVEVTANVDIEVPVAALSLTGYAPEVEATAHVDIEVPVAALTLTGYAPEITVTGGVDIEIPVAALTLTGYVPEIQAGENIEVEVPVAALALTGYAPTVTTTAHVSIEVPIGSLEVTGYAPIVTTTGHVSVEIPVGALELTGYAPIVTGDIVSAEGIALTLRSRSTGLTLVARSTELTIDNRSTALTLEDR